MNGRRNEDRLYTAILLAFLVGLVVIGLLGVPALLVAAIGAAVAALAIAVLRPRLESLGTDSSRSSTKRQKVPERYVPRVLESGSMRRRRTVHLLRHRDTSPPLRFR
jgi:hypothetical protein